MKKNKDLIISAKLYSKIRPSDRMRLAGRKVIARYFKVFCDLEAGTMAGDQTENLHQMRVSVRRMRVALRYLKSYFPKRQTKRFLKDLKKMAGLLGNVRDMDTFLIFVNQCQESNAEQLSLFYKNVEESVLAMREKRLARLQEEFRAETYISLKQDLHNFIAAKGKRETGRVRDEFPMVICSVLDRILEYDPIQVNSRDEELHELRILFKRFRYLCEAFQKCYGPKLKKVIKLAETMQNYLGEVQDKCRDIQFMTDEWNQRDSHGRNEDFNGFLEQMQTVKQKNLKLFLKNWQKFTSLKSRKKIYGILHYIH